MLGRNPSSTSVQRYRSWRLTSGASNTSGRQASFDLIHRMKLDWVVASLSQRLTREVRNSRATVDFVAVFSRLPSSTTASASIADANIVLRKSLYEFAIKRSKSFENRSRFLDRKPETSYFTLPEAHVHHREWQIRRNNTDLHSA